MDILEVTRTLHKHVTMKSSPRIARALLVSLGACFAAACATSGDSTSLSGGSTSGGVGGSTAVECTGCVTTAACGPGRSCAQFAGDTYCATDCSGGGACPSGDACMPVNSAEGTATSVCIPVATPCGVTMSTTGAGGNTGTSSGSTSASTTASSSGSGTCAHSICTSGAKLTTGCDPCATQICATDSYCCDTSWSSQCVNEVASICGESCTGGTSSSSSSSSSTGSVSSSSGSSGTTIGPLSTLSFAIVGDTRPPNEDDTSGYPTAIITKIWQDVEAASPRPAFAVATGDYMFASPSHTPGTQAAQMSLYLTARAAFSNPLYPAMGNHECDGATADNCYACGSACNTVGGSCIGGVCQTPNYVQFLSKMLAPVAQTLPYYTLNVNGTGNAWSAKFVYIACNAWSPTQATWLASQLSNPTTYTFVVRHEGTTATTAPCLSGTGSNNADTILSQHPYTLLIAGHTHTYAYYSSEKQVIVGNGGAPLSGSVNYGYVIARQSGSSIVFNEYDYATNAVSNTFTVQ